MKNVPISSKNVHFLYINAKDLPVFRCPAAMKAASEEVKKIFESSNQRADPKDPRLVLTREQLDNTPVLGRERYTAKSSGALYF